MFQRHETEHKSFQTPDEVRDFPHGTASILNIGGGSVGRLVFQPGWRWSTDVKEIAKTDSCQAVHTGTLLSGRLHVKMADGTEEELGPGDVYHIPAGHDAWVVGNEPVVGVEVTGNFEWAKPRS